MTTKERVTLKAIRLSISKIADKCASMNQYIESDVWDEIEEDLRNINREIRTLYDKPKQERKHFYCKDCAYFPYSEHINGPWRECMRSKYVKGKHEGELRRITASDKKCPDFLPAGEHIDYHEGINELLNNIQIKESEADNE